MRKEVRRFTGGRSSQVASRSGVAAVATTYLTIACLMSGRKIRNSWCPWCPKPFWSLEAARPSLVLTRHRRVCWCCMGHQNTTTRPAVGMAIVGANIIVQSHDPMRPHAHVASPALASCELADPTPSCSRSNGVQPMGASWGQLAGINQGTHVPVPPPPTSKASTCA